MFIVPCISLLTGSKTWNQPPTQQDNTIVDTYLFQEPYTTCKSVELSGKKNLAHFVRYIGEGVNTWLNKRQNRINQYAIINQINQTRHGSIGVLPMFTYQSMLTNNIGYALIINQKLEILVLEFA